MERVNHPSLKTHTFIFPLLGANQFFLLFLSFPLNFADPIGDKLSLPVLN